MHPSTTTGPYTILDNGAFRMEQFASLPPFAGFLPGIAGKQGVPVWAFYVNRGQGIAGFGLENKDHAVMEFHPADKAYRNVYTEGFRTFIKLHQPEGTVLLEPFSPASAADPSVEETMTVEAEGLSLTCFYPAYSLFLEVRYFTLPSAPVGALIRRVRLTNTGTEPMVMEVLDGLPAVLPAGVPNAAYKEISNTLKSWFDVEWLDETAPFYTLRGSFGDEAEVKPVDEGSFYASLLHDSSGKSRRIQPVVDPSLVFDHDTSLTVPAGFLRHEATSLAAAPQRTTNKVSCAFTPVSIELQADQPLDIWSAAGASADAATAAGLVDALMDPAVLAAKEQEAAAISREVTLPAAMQTADPRLDAYASQCFLDNGLRGGFPSVIAGREASHVYYLYSRKHGDLERDYNFFSIQPGYYPQGNGNYRDINQNRRMDVYTEPAVYDRNIHYFMNLIQLDGANPLEVQAVFFRLSEEDASSAAADFPSCSHVLQHHLVEGFTPGSALALLERYDAIPASMDAWLGTLLDKAEEIQPAAHKEGFWIDHWTYNLDLIEQFLAVYPDREQELFFTDKYHWFSSPARILPRKDKYVTRQGQVRQYEAVAPSSSGSGSWVTTADGRPLTTNLYSKLVVLAAVKIASMAPGGLGISMETEKPGWNDSLNGLPGMLGASTSELMELQRLLGQLQRIGASASVPTELLALLDTLEQAGSDLKPETWDSVVTALETYREKLDTGISGQTELLTADRVQHLLTLFAARVGAGLHEAASYGTLMPTFFYFEAAPGAETEDILSGKALEPVPVPLFLEGAVKQLKTARTAAEAARIHDAVRKTSLYDEKLGMYRTSENLADTPAELGRVRAFTPGWLENESIFLHMEYKYLLELLKRGLPDTFYEETAAALIPYQDPAVYGRSTLENSSFLASSANPDPSLHGRGFVARLSGSTVEFLEMRQHMLTGAAPFSVAEGTLRFCPEPVLPASLFREDGTLSFRLFTSCEVTYVQDPPRATYGPDAARPVQYELTWKDGRSQVVESSFLEQHEAEALRGGHIQQMRITLA
ncbi:hypothetical protein [Alkalicoccus chagannorensis]|uniref:hypothetical protein n=1 Tax=Alkalicoccus chagannorensis TaxID=427072 RepID=UPI00040B3FEA|nr:hypothetical protein [Alkalicoccus chagannorensis]